MHYLHALLPIASAVVLVAFVRARPCVGWLLLWFEIVSAYDYAGLTRLANFGGIAIYPADVVGICLLVAIVLTPGALRRLAPVDLWLWIPVVLAIALSLARGVSEFGLGVAANEARATVQLAGAALWVWGRMRLPGFERSWRNWIILTGLALVADELFHIHERGIGQVDQLITVHGQLVTSRPLVAYQALVLGLIGLALLVRERHRWLRVLGLAFLAMSILCQHRSVWAALIAGMVMVVIGSPRARMRLLALAFVGGVALLVLYAAGTLDPLLSKFSLALNSHGTLYDRINADRALTDEQSRMGIVTQLIGQPYGSGYLRLNSDGVIETFAPHNYYVLLYLRIGLVGAGLFALALLRGLWSGLSSRDARRMVVASGLIVFCLAYNLSLLLAPFLAIALAAGGLDASSRRPPPGVHEEHVLAEAAS